MRGISEEVSVKDIMHRDVITIPDYATVRDAACRMCNENVGALVVIDEKKQEALGLITDRDIVVRVIAAGKDADMVLVREVMSSPVEVIPPETSINDAAQKMVERRIKKLPVVDKNNNLVGIVTYSDFLRAYPGYVDVLKELLKLHSVEAEG